MVDDANIKMTGQRIICNYIIDLFGKRDILPEEAVHNLVTGYMEAEYVTYEYDKEKGMEKESINLQYRYAYFILTFELYCMVCEEGEIIINRVN